jgi:hypothetical protein
LEVCAEVYSTASLSLAVLTEGKTGWAPEPLEALKVEKNLLPLLGVVPSFLGCSARGPVTTPSEAPEGGYDTLCKSRCEVSTSLPLGFPENLENVIKH